MLLLGIDTSGRHGSLALARASPELFTVLEVVPLAGGTYSAQLIPELQALLVRHDLNRSSLEGIGVVSGPGSFTGLRVGLATAKGLAEILHLPLAAVSMLEAVAAQSQAEGRVIAVLDAGRKELYVGEYDVSGGEVRRMAESLLAWEQFSALLQSNPSAELITPDPAVAVLAGRHAPIHQIGWPDAGEIARLGYRKIQAGQAVPPETLQANYLRRSNAEIFAPRHLPEK